MAGFRHDRLPNPQKSTTTSDRHGIRGCAHASDGHRCRPQAGAEQFNGQTLGFKSFELKAFIWLLFKKRAEALPDMEY